MHFLSGKALTKTNKGDEFGEKKTLLSIFGIYYKTKRDTGQIIQRALAKKNEAAL